MNNQYYTDDELYDLAIRARKSMLYSYAAKAVTEHFRSMHYKSSMLVCDCVLLNVLLNDKITHNSADKIITIVRRKNKSLYTTIDNAFIPISDDFDEYAKAILNDEYDDAKKLDLRIANYVVYVISKDVAAQYGAQHDKNEVYGKVYTYAELLAEKHKKKLK